MTEWVAKNRKNETTDIEIRGKIIPKAIVQILHNRGYDTPDRIEKFFAPSLNNLHDPFLINDMEKAVDRIVKAMHNKERIFIHGDYDTDGITGSALLVGNLRKLGFNVDYYIPHRLYEGYGLSLGGIEQAIKSRCPIIITVDCGITATDEILYANKNNIDVIVCDHHKPKDVLPMAYALLNPKISESKYPFKELAGVGVAFKMIQALYKKLNFPDEEAYQNLDLVALGSVVDVVPLVDENRIMVKYGLRKMSKSKNVGVQAILEEVGLEGELTSYHLGFIIGPRINACGRLRDAKEALELFLTKDRDCARGLARNLSLDNQSRKEIEDTIYNEAKILIECEARVKDNIIVLGKEGWHEGVVGIVASRISEDYYRPAIILSLKKDSAKGSARSVTGFDITDALSSCHDLLIKYGGHSQAAGLEMKTDNINQLREQINSYIKNFGTDIFQRRSFYDTALNLDEVTDEVLFFLKYFEPTGMANPQPVFLGEEFEVVGVPRVVGSDHLKFALRNRGKAFDAIAYGQAESILNIEVGKTRVNCLYSVSENSFTGKKKPVLKVKEMRKNAV